MRLIAHRVLREFAERHAGTAVPLQDFRRLIEMGEFTCFADLRTTFASVDKVGEQHAFNIGGNKYRLIAVIAFSARCLWIKAVLTHADYDKGDWR